MKGVTANKVRANIESGRDEINTREMGLKVKESSTSGEVAEKFKGGERDKKKIGEYIDNRDKETHLTEEAVNLIDARTNAVKEYVGKKMPKSIKDGYSEFKKDVGVTAREKLNFDNESAKQIDGKKDKK